VAGRVAATWSDAGVRAVHGVDHGAPPIEDGARGGRGALVSEVAFGYVQASRS
jgi:hypothetical protein